MAFEVVNVGGGAAWNVDIFLLRILGETLEGQSEAPESALDSLGSDSYFDLCPECDIGLLQPSDSRRVNVTLRTLKSIERLTGVEVLATTHDSRAQTGLDWGSESSTGIPATLFDGIEEWALGSREYALNELPPAGSPSPEGASSWERGGGHSRDKRRHIRRGDLQTRTVTQASNAVQGGGRSCLP